MDTFHRAAPRLQSSVLTTLEGQLLVVFLAVIIYYTEWLRIYIFTKCG
jgi:hypothetical protein